MRTMVAKHCEQCGAEYRCRADHITRSRFCSVSCKSTFVARANAERRGDMQRGRGEGKTYRKRGGRHEHRVVAEQKIGRPLAKGEIVHHIDGNKLNNHPDNLAVMTQRQHMIEHGVGIPGVTPAHKPWEKRGRRHV